MRVTKIRNKDGSKVEHFTLVCVMKELEQAMERAGFITNVEILNDSSMKIGLHMRSFRIDTSVLGYNADVSDLASKAKVGYKRTSTPTWSQREQYNHIINDIFDGYKIMANIKNSAVEIRTFDDGRINSWDMDRFSSMGTRAYYEIMSISEVGAA